jgi:hypothetical protein
MLKQMVHIRAVITVDYRDTSNIKFNSPLLISVAPTTTPRSFKSANCSKKVSKYNSHVSAGLKKIVENTKSSLLRERQRTTWQGGMGKWYSCPCS